MPPAVASSSTHYALVIDAGSSGSRLQIYSWRDPDLERAEIIEEVRTTEADIAATLRGDDGQTTGGWPWVESPKADIEGQRKWWWPSNYIPGSGSGKGKGKDAGLGELEKRALRRLVRVGKGVEGEDWVKRAEPGISTVSPSDIPDYLSPLLTHAATHIPPSQHANTPIYIYATAGMRLLPLETQTAILKATCDTVRNEYPFQVGRPSAAGPCGENVRVISGEEEGLWGWVAVNYLMDGFGHAPPYGTVDAAPSSSASLLPLAPLAEPPPASAQDSVTPVDVSHHSPTFGFLDMGGASTQLAFSPSELELSRSGYPVDQLRKVSLRLLSGEEVDWEVFVASWLGFGTNRVRERYVDTLLASWRNSTAAADISTPIPDPCLPIDLLIPSSADGTSPPLIGTGSFDTCLTDLKPLLDRAQDCPANHCLFAGLPTPHIDFTREDQRGFIGVSEYWYTAHQVLGLGGIWDWGEWEQGMGDFCSRDWKTVEEEVEREKGWRGAQLELSRLQMQCFKGAWISNVLHDGIGIPRLIDSGGRETLTGGELGDTNAEAERRAREKGLIEDTGVKSQHEKGKTHFQSMDEIGSTAISWTLGKMVIEASKAVPPRSLAHESAWRNRLPTLGLGAVGNRLEGAGIHALWAYIAFLAIFILFIWNWIKRRRFSLSGNSPKSGNGRRKRSTSTISPMTSSPTSWSFWPTTNMENMSLEDGYSSDLSSRSSNGSTKTVAAKARLWSMKLSNALRRQTTSHRSSSATYDILPRTSILHMGNRTNPSRHASMPVHMSSSIYSSSHSSSQPPSPHGSHFIPGLSNGNDSEVVGLTVPFSRTGSTSPEPRRLGASSSAGEISSLGSSGYSASHTHTPHTSPPRSKNRPLRARQNSYNTGSAVSGGWNDPPTTLLSVTTTGLEGSHDSGSGRDGVLTPSAGGTDRTLSRQSSRVNLSEIGLKERSGSRLGNY